jgi:NAD(P)-dependent dehydrogenase (short-subunit alcohol dehydrogenase family)
VSVRADVRDLPALRAAVADVLRAFGRIDVLAANAGINAPVPLLHARDDEFTRHWRNRARRSTCSGSRTPCARSCRT